MGLLPKVSGAPPEVMFFPKVPAVALKLEDYVDARTFAEGTPKLLWPTATLGAVNPPKFKPPKPPVFTGACGALVYVVKAYGGGLVTTVSGMLAVAFSGTIDTVFFIPSMGALGKTQSRSPSPPTISSSSPWLSEFTSRARAGFFLGVSTFAENALMAV